MAQVLAPASAWTEIAAETLRGTVEVENIGQAALWVVQQDTAPSTSTAGRELIGKDQITFPGGRSIWARPINDLPGLAQVEPTGLSVGAGVVQPQDFGAVGDGVTDDADAFNNAIAEISARGGGMLFVPRPTSFYLTGSTINLASGVKLVFDSLAWQNGFYTYIRPTSAVTIGVDANEVDGLWVQGLVVDMQDMPANSVGIRARSCWSDTWEKCGAYGCDEATSKCWDIRSDSGASQGNYWSHYSDCVARGTAGKGFSMQGQSGSPKRMTSTVMINPIAVGVDEGFDFDNVGSGITIMNVSAEGCSSHGMSISDTSGGTAVQIFGGEISGNGGWGITGDGDVTAHQIAYSGNTSGDVDDNVTRIENGNTLRSGTAKAFWKADRFLSTSSTVAVAAADTISADFGSVRISGSGGAVTMTSDPQIASPQDSSAQMITLMGGDNTNTVTLVDGAGLRLTGDCTLALEDSITLMYHTSFGDWVEISRSVSVTQTYSVTTAGPIRTFDTSTVTLSDLARVVGAIVTDLKDKGDFA